MAGPPNRSSTLPGAIIAGSYLSPSTPAFGTTRPERRPTPPKMLLKVVLAAYAHGVVSSRGIERLCQEHVTFIALCGDQAPHFTTIAHFVSTLSDDIARVFGAVVAICDREGLIGHEMFAIDGVKLPSNASKHRSGTREDFERQAAKLESETKRLEQRATELRDWLALNPEDRRGPNRSSSC